VSKASRLRLLLLIPTVLAVGAASDVDSGLPGDAAGVDAEPEISEALPARQAATVVDLPVLDVAALRRASGAAEPRNAFESKSWYVPPPAPPAPSPAQAAPPPAPTAPRLPFTYLGQYQEGPKLVILLMQGERMLVVNEGDLIDATYRVDGIRGATLTLTYLPLNIKQLLNVDAPG
jgi:hypothetical protein